MVYRGSVAGGDVDIALLHGICGGCVAAYWLRIVGTGCVCYVVDAASVLVRYCMHARWRDTACSMVRRGSIAGGNVDLCHSRVWVVCV